MVISKRYQIAKRLVLDALKKEKYFKKKEKMSYEKFYGSYFRPERIYNYQFWRSYGEKHYGERIANMILYSIAQDAEKGIYYDKNEISDIIDLKIRVQKSMFDSPSIISENEK